jgi:hypothetical protein
MTDHRLEPEAQRIADATSRPPYFYQMTPTAARAVLDDLQAQPTDKPDADETWTTVASPVGDVKVRVVRPVGTDGPLPTILYLHGGGWVLGNAATHEMTEQNALTDSRFATQHQSPAHAIASTAHQRQEPCQLTISTQQLARESPIRPLGHEVPRH